MGDTKMNNFCAYYRAFNGAVADMAELKRERDSLKAQLEHLRKYATGQANKSFELETKIYYLKKDLEAAHKALVAVRENVESVKSERSQALLDVDYWKNQTLEAERALSSLRGQYIRRDPDDVKRIEALERELSFMKDSLRISETLAANWYKKYINVLRKGDSQRVADLENAGACRKTDFKEMRLQRDAALDRARKAEASVEEMCKERDGVLKILEERNKENADMRTRLDMVHYAADPGVEISRGYQDNGDPGFIVKSCDVKSCG